MVTIMALVVVACGREQVAGGAVHHAVGVDIGHRVIVPGVRGHIHEGQVRLPGGHEGHFDGYPTPGLLEGPGAVALLRDWISLPLRSVTVTLPTS